MENILSVTALFIMWNALSDKIINWQVLRKKTDHHLGSYGIYIYIYTLDPRYNAVIRLRYRVNCVIARTALYLNERCFLSHMVTP